MKKWLLPGLLLGILALWGVTCWWTGKDSERNRQEAQAYRDSTNLLRARLDTALTKRDSIIDTVKVERVRIVERTKQVEVVKTEFQRDTTTADSLGTALKVIAVQDTLIAQQSGHIKTLNELVAADSGIIRLYQSQRLVDSTRIRRLERQVLGPRILGIRLPKLKCIAGPVAVGFPTVQAGLGLGCGLTF